MAISMVASIMKSMMMSITTNMVVCMEVNMRQNVRYKEDGNYDRIINVRRLSFGGQEVFRAGLLMAMYFSDLVSNSILKAGAAIGDKVRQVAGERIEAALAL